MKKFNQKLALVTLSLALIMPGLSSVLIPTPVSAVVKTKKQTKVTVKSKTPIYNFAGRKISPKGYHWPKKTKIAVNGAFYLWNEDRNKAELYYHLTDRCQKMIKAGKSKKVNLGDAFVKTSDVKISRKLKAQNSALTAENNHKIAASESDLITLNELIKNSAQIKKSKRYQQASAEERYNYREAINDAKKALKHDTLSAARVQYLIWQANIAIKAF
ncbi:hypothetical protein [Lactobacillus sp. HT06-2]|uniref:hypothetical protein n=1 Tax=Lactobacillus sp. HT06-2 TaxID=2080222 RepID=UPI000CD965DE|nr:hypothetical protein [Lactobacillus sp. HT06-2]